MKKFRVLLSLLLVAFLALGFVAGCGSDSDDGGDDSTTGTVTGTVTDQNNQPINGALCSVSNLEAKATYSDYTDESGVYEITNVPEGSWILTISADGYVSQTQDITVVGGQTSEIPAVEMPVQGFGDVTGTVTSDLIGGTVIAGATVTVGSVSTTSATDGTYTAADVAAGTQTVSATATGFVAYSSTVTVVADTTVTKDIAMTPSSTASPTPSPGYGNVAGKVVDVNGTGLADVTVTLQKGGKATTDSTGAYLVENLTPGVRTLAYAKTGYDSKTQDVTVEADTTVTATTVTLTTTPTTGVTSWVSKRINLPEVNDAVDADVSNDGSKVVFTSNGNVIVNWNNPPTTPTHIYVWTRATGTITRVSNNNLVSGSTAGANGNSSTPAISGDGNFVVFRSLATDILPNGLATTNNGDIFMVKLADNSIARLSNAAANANNGGDAASSNPDINGDGTKVVFQSLATNIGNIVHTAGYSHIYYVVVTDMTPGVRRMLDITLTSTQGIGLQGTAAADPTAETPASANPSISYDGRYTTFQSRACVDVDTGLIGANIVASGGPTLADAIGVGRESTTHIYRNDINADPATGWNIIVSKHNGALAIAPDGAGTATNGELNGTPTCQLPVVNEGGAKIAFQSAATNLGNTAAVNQNIYLWNLNSAALTYVSIPLSGAVGANTNAMIDRSGQYVGFLSTTVGLVSDVTDALARVYVKDVNLGQNVYTMVSRGSSDQVPDVACALPAMSGDGNYVAWQTAAKNLTNDSYTAGIVDIFVRKWK